jgi:hypothetical protein
VATRKTTMKTVLTKKRRKKKKRRRRKGKMGEESPHPQQGNLSPIARSAESSRRSRLRPPKTQMTMRKMRTSCSSIRITPQRS